MLGIRNLAAVGTAALAMMPVTAFATPVIPTSLSVGGMFLQAHWVVKLVMIGLALASVATWTVFIAKLLELRKATATEQQVHDQVIALRSLRDAALDSNLAFTSLVREALTEMRLSSDALSDPEGIKERVVSRFQRHEASVARNMTRGVNVLASHVLTGQTFAPSDLTGVEAASDDERVSRIADVRCVPNRFLERNANVDNSPFSDSHCIRRTE